MTCRRLPNFDDQASAVREFGDSGNAPLRNNAFIQKFRDNKMSKRPLWKPGGQLDPTLWLGNTSKVCTDDWEILLRTLPLAQS